MTVSFQKGFTFGTSTNFKVGLPEIVGGETALELGASTEYQVSYHTVASRGLEVWRRCTMSSKLRADSVVPFYSFRRLLIT